MRRCSLLALGITVSILSGCKPDDVVQPHTVAQTSGADLADVSDPTPSTIALEHLTSLAGPGPAAAEITTFDRVSQRLFVANATFRTMDVYDMKDPAAPGSSPRSTSCRSGLRSTRLPHTAAWWRWPCRDR